MKPLPPPRGGDPSIAPPFEDPALVTQSPPEQRAFVDAYTRVGRPRIALVVDASGAAAGGDDAAPRAIDYQAVETIMRDWIRSNGQVTLISVPPGNNPASNIDIFVHVRAEPTRQAQQNVAVRMVAEATNTRDGVIIGSAVVDVPPPLEKTQINTYTRFLARKLMDDMAATWNAAPPRAAAPIQPAAPLQVPPPQPPAPQNPSN